MNKSFLCLLLLLPSCGIYTRLNDAVERVDIATKQAEESLQGVEAGLKAMGDKGEALAAKVAEIRTAVVDADKNKDGKVLGLDEWYGLIVQLLAILGIGGYAVQTNTKRRENVQALYEQLDGLKDRIRDAAPPAAR